MIPYQNRTPRAALAMVAIAFTAITAGLMIVLPATMDSTRLTPVAIATAAPMPPAPAPATATVAVARLDAPAADVPTRFGRIDVVATRERKVALVQTAPSRPKL